MRSRTLATQVASIVVVLFTGLIANANIFEKDRRADVWPVPARLQPVGILRALPDDGLWGTAFLVGQCHIVTAFHVAFPQHKNPGFVPSEKITSRFFVGRTEKNRGSPGGFVASAIATPVAWGQFSTRSYEGLRGDWAILKLDDCLGRSFGFVDFSPPIRPNEERASRVHFAGFPRDRQGSRGVTYERGCLIQDFGPGFLNGFDCALIPGASGGPVFEERDGALYAIGIAIRELHPVEKIVPRYDIAYRNIILLSEEFIGELERVLGTSVK